MRVLSPWASRPTVVVLLLALAVLTVGLVAPPAPARAAEQTDWIGEIEYGVEADEDNGGFGYFSYFALEETQPTTAAWSTWARYMTGADGDGMCGEYVDREYEGNGAGGATTDITVTRAADPRFDVVSVNGSPDSAGTITVTDNSCYHEVTNGVASWNIGTSTHEQNFHPYPINSVFGCSDPLTVPAGAQVLKALVTCAGGEAAVGTAYQTRISILLRARDCDGTVDVDGDGHSDCSEWQVSDPYDPASVPPVQNLTVEVEGAYGYEGNVLPASAWASGYDQVEVTGDAANRVTVVCIDTTWTATVLYGATSGAVEWNETTPIGLDILDTGHNLADVDVVRGRGRGASGVNLSYDEWIKYRTCGPPTEGVFRAPFTLRAEPYTGTFTRLSHEMSAVAYLADGRSMPIAVPGSSSDRPSPISWQQSAIQSFSVTP